MPCPTPCSVLLALLTLLTAAPAQAGVSVQQGRIPQGTHWRIAAPEGVLHILEPNGFRQATAGVVLYVHGFNTSADKAWRRYGLAAQLTASRRNALYVVVEGARSLEDGVRFSSLKRVLALVTRHRGRALPSGHLVAVGHSGGYWTIASWLKHQRLDRVILLDGMYGFWAEYRRWIATPGHKLVFVARGTRRLSRRFIRGLRGALERRDVPRSARGFTARQRKARVLHIDSQYSHVGIVSSRRVLPVVLHLCGLAARNNGSAPGAAPPPPPLSSLK